MNIEFEAAKVGNRRIGKLKDRKIVKFGPTRVELLN
jgi:hypothetical protein